MNTWDACLLTTAGAPVVSENCPARTRRQAENAAAYSTLALHDARRQVDAVDVAQEAGNSAETRLRYYAHLFAEFDPARRESAEEEVGKAR